MKVGNLLVIFVQLGLLSGCAGLLEGRTFIDEMERESDGFFVAGRDFQTVPGDTGLAYRSDEEIRMRTPASESEAYEMAQNSALYQELIRKERGLTPRAREVYNEAMPHLETVSEKIYFLDLTPYEQQDYLAMRNIPLPSRLNYRSPSRGLASLQPVFDRTLNLGMSKDEVINIWGRPAKVEVAGNPYNENERWAFFENGNVKFVYFEAGRVQGWNIQ